MRSSRRAVLALILGAVSGFSERYRPSYHRRRGPEARSRASSLGARDARAPRSVCTARSARATERRSAPAPGSLISIRWWVPLRLSSLEGLTSLRTRASTVRGV